jgi:hypothetical protein
MFAQAVKAAGVQKKKKKKKAELFAEITGAVPTEITKISSLMLAEQS